jgi:hypothetical protein
MARINPCFKATPVSAAGPVRGAVMPILIVFGAVAARTGFEMKNINVTAIAKKNNH